MQLLKFIHQTRILSLFPTNVTNERRRERGGGGEGALYVWGDFCQLSRNHH